MSKTVKSYLMKDYESRLSETSECMIISVRGLKGIDATRFRKTLQKNKIRVLVVRNALAKRQLKGTALEGLAPLLTGPSAIAFGGASVVEVAREIVGLIKDFPGVELKGAILDGTLFSGDKGVKELSKYPTRGEAIGQAVTLLVSPGRNLGAQIKGPGSNIAGIVKAIELKLEKGEAIAKK
jgi:large subunit ribosomal protein L10